MCYLEHQYLMASRIHLYCTSNSFLMQYSACQQSHIVNVTQGNLENFQLNCSKVLIQMDGLRFNQESGTEVIVLLLFLLFIVPFCYSDMLELWRKRTVALQFTREGTLCQGAFIYDVRYFLGIFDLPTYPHQILYYISLFSKIR